MMSSLDTGGNCLIFNSCRFFSTVMILWLFSNNHLSRLFPSMCLWQQILWNTSTPSLPYFAGQAFPVFLFPSQFNNFASSQPCLFPSSYLFMAGKQAKVIPEIHLQEGVIYVKRHRKHPLRNLEMLLFLTKRGFEQKKWHLFNGLGSQMEKGTCLMSSVSLSDQG